MSRALLFTLVILLTGCGYKKVTIYDDCFEHKITFSSDRAEPIVGFDYDESAEQQYSMIRQPQGEYIVSLSSDHFDRDSPYEKGWRPRSLGHTDDEIVLTGQYAYVRSRFLQAVVDGDSHLLQAKVHGHIIWLPIYVFDRRDVNERYREGLDYLFSRSTFDEYGWIETFTCPNTEVRERFWSHINALE